MREVVYVRDLDMSVLYINPASEQLTGWSQEEAKGKKCYEVFGDERATCREGCPAEKAIAERAHILHHEGSLKTPSGEIHEMQVSISPIYEEERVAGALVVMEDITWLKEVEKTGAKTVAALERELERRKQVEEKLRASEARFRALSENTFEAIFLSEKSICTGQNLAAEKMFGYSTEEAIGRHGTDWIAPEYRELVRKNMGLDYASPYEVMALRKDGTTFPCEIRGKMIDDQGRLIRVTALRDTTEHKKAEEALRESEDRFRLIAEQSLMAIGIIQDGVYKYFNKAYEQISGYSADEIKKWEPFELTKTVHPDDRSFVTEQVRKKQTGHTDVVPHYSFRGISKGGDIKWLEIYSKTVTYQNRPADLVAFIDITERKRAEMEREKLQAQLSQAQKMEAVGTLAGGIAHDFNNLLQVVLGYSDLLLVDKSRNDRDYDALNEIRRQARNGAELVKRILTFSRKADTSSRPIDLNREVRKAKQLLARTLPKIIEIELFLDEDLRKVDADPGQIEQILLNLAVNAKDAMPRGGKIVIETENATLHEDYCRSHLGVEPGVYVLLTFSDTGVGIYPEILDHIFEPFFTTKKPGEGTGLGLAAVYGIVKQHNGRIMCYSEPEKGTTFKIYLPGLKMEEEASTQRVQEMPAGGAETILLVEDEASVREFGKRALSKAGYTVLTAGNGQEALEIYREKWSEIHLVVMDLIMPVRDGRECLEELLKINRSVKVIVASGYSVNGLARRAVKSGAKGFIRKPFDIRQMLEIVRSVLDETRGQVCS